jgi:predicted ArsR family transcriptional regulator
MPPLDADLIAMLDRVREIFGDEILADIYERAQNATIRQAGPPDTPAADAADGGRLRLVADAADDGFVRALRDELDRLLTHH